MLDRSEIKTSSQYGEDGVIREIMTRINGSVDDLNFVEIGAHVNESNMLLFADEHNATGVFVDANPEEAEALRSKYENVDRVTVVCTIVNESNINELVHDTCEIVSIDVDGRDYFLWEALQARPKVVVIEYNGSVPRGLQLVNESYDWDGSANFGASIDALIHLGHKKSYSLVHTTRQGVNAFFVRDDLTHLFPECNHPLIRKAHYNIDDPSIGIPEHPNLDLATFVEVSL